MCYVLGDLCGEQAAVVSKRNEQLDTGLVQPRSAHQSDCVNVVRYGHHQAPSAQTDRIYGRVVYAVRFIRHMVSMTINYQSYLFRYLLIVSCYGDCIK